MFPVNSPNIKAIGYTPDARLLQVDFLAGSYYRYFLLTDLWSDRFVAVSSIGRFLNREIKKVYQYCQID